MHEDRHLTGDGAKTGLAARDLDRERALDPMADELIRDGQREHLGQREELNEHGEPTEPRCPECGDPRPSDSVLCVGCRPDISRPTGRGPV